MDKSLKDRLLQFGSGASLVATLFGQSNVANANPMFRPMEKNAIASLAIAGSRREQNLAMLVLEPSESSQTIFIGHKSHSSHRSHSSHHSSQAGSSFSGSSQPKTSSSRGSRGDSDTTSRSASMGLLGNQSDRPEPKLKTATPRISPPPKPANYIALDLPARVFVSKIGTHVNGRVFAVLIDEKSEQSIEIDIFDDFRGWTVTNIDLGNETVLLENLTGEGPELPNFKLKKKSK